MNNNMRFLLKLLGLIHIEITNISPKDLIKILLTIAAIIVLITLLPNIINYVTHYP